MIAEEFAARRREEFVRVDDELRGPVAQALAYYASGRQTWYSDLVDDAAVIWLEHFLAEAPNADPEGAYYNRFIRDVTEALQKTEKPESPVADYRVERVLMWLGTYIVNNATFSGVSARGGRFKRWVTMGDSAVRETHVAVNGQIATIGGTFDVGGFDLHYPGEPIGPPEIWINCVVGSTEVDWPGQNVLAVTRREQTGAFVDLRTADGHNLTVTPNHPVLTPGGYVPAHALRPGDQVMASRLAVAPQVADMEPRVEQVYRAATERGQTTRVGGGAVDFHGDIAAQEVEVVWPDSDLSAELGRESMERLLIRAASIPIESAIPVGAAVAGSGVSVGGCGLTASVLSALGEVATLLRTHPRHAEAVRLGPATDNKIEFFEALDDDVATDTEFLTHLQHAIAAGMTVSQIIEVEQYSATHEVYNLHTSDQWYTANGITVHNCRCVLQPAARTGEANVTPTTFAITDETDIAVEPADEEDLPNDDLEDGEEEITEVPVHGVLAPEGVATGDGRMFADGALTNRELPLPILYQEYTGEGHGGSARVGRIDEVFREGNEVRFRGAIVLTKEFSNSVIEGIVDGTVRGISVDVDDIELEMDLEDMLEGDGLTVFSHARVAGVTIVAIPAFQEAYISLGHEFVDELPEDEQALIASCGCEYGGTPGAVIDGQTVDDNPDIEVGYDAFKEYDAEARKRMAEDGRALEDGSFPIADCEDLANAIQSIGRASDPAAAQAHIKKRKSALGCEDIELPEDWSLAAAAFAPGTKDGPGWLSHPVPTARLRRYWTTGPGGAKIRWNTPGDFTRCTRQLRKYIANPGWLAGACANLHFEATGRWPGRQRGDKGLLSLTPAERVGAGALLASATPALVSAGVQRIGFADVVAVAADGSSRKAPAQILRSGRSLQMRRSDAEAVTAQVVNVHALGDFTVLSLVREDVGSDSAVLPVAAIVPGAAPQEAFTIRSGEVLELRLRSAEWVTVGENSAVVALAHALAEPTGGALADFGVDTPVHTAQSTTPAPIFNMVAAASPVLDSNLFAKPEDGTGIGVVVDGEHIFGYIAQWGSCHIGVEGFCREVPQSPTNYAYYATGVVDTDEGPIHVGQITMDTGHASLRSSARVAAAHYDNTGACVADVAVGEDAFGIWFSGRLRPNATEAQIHALKASGRLSGDWRLIGGTLELVAALAVNVPGFPIPNTLTASADGVQSALVAAGIVDPQTTPAVTASAEKMTPEMIAAISRNAVAEYRHQEKREVKTSAIRATLRAQRVAELRSKIGN